MKASPIGITCLLLAVAGVGLFGIGFIPPAIPVEWRSISVGIPRSQVLAEVPDEIRDMRESKGFDLATREFRQWGIRHCWWQLELTYDSSNLVKTAEACFTDPCFGVYNSGWEAIE